MPKNTKESSRKYVHYSVWRGRVGGDSHPWLPCCFVYAYSSALFLSHFVRCILLFIELHGPLRLCEKDSVKTLRFRLLFVICKIKTDYAIIHCMLRRTQSRTLWKDFCSRQKTENTMHYFLMNDFLLGCNDATGNLIN